MGNDTLGGDKPRPMTFIFRALAQFLLACLLLYPLRLDPAAEFALDVMQSHSIRYFRACFAKYDLHIKLVLRQSVCQHANQRQSINPLKRGIRRPPINTCIDNNLSLFRQLLCLHYCFGKILLIFSIVPDNRQRTFGCHELTLLVLEQPWIWYLFPVC